MVLFLGNGIISEMRKEIPLLVKNWFFQKNENSFFISSVTIAELMDGIERLPASTKKIDLMAWFFGEVLDRFSGKILPIDENVAKTWGQLSASLRKMGITIGVKDLYIAATAHVHSLAILTLNEKHFIPTNIAVINPWKS
jgi:predicted nucleic acid-binding protein